MQSKARFVLRSLVGIFGALFLVSGFIGLASAAPVNAYSVQPNFNNNQYYSLNYMMGTVSMPGSYPIGGNQTPSTPTSNTPVNLVPVSNACQNYLNTFNKFGSNGPEVVKLQQFLNQYNGANLNGLGFYGPATEREVKNLQYAYGIRPTGAQYEKTTNLINAIKCGVVQTKPRTIYPGVSMSYVGSSSSYVSTGTNTISSGENIYPNPTPNPPKNYPTKTSVVNPPMTGNLSSSTMNTASPTSFGETFGKDFQKVKDNYKAYVLVFVLVLALFWFLRKAATE